MSDATRLDPDQAALALLRSNNRRAATIGELLTALASAREGMDADDHEDRFQEAYQVLVAVLLQELARRGIQGQIELLRLLEATEDRLGPDLANATAGFAPEATRAYLDRCVAAGNRMADFVPHIFDEHEQTGLYRYSYDSEWEGVEDLLALHAKTRPEGKTLGEDRQLTWAFYGLEDDERPLLERWDELMAAFGLERHGENVKRLLVPAVAIGLVAEACPPGASRFGGWPDRPEGLPWPTSKAGRPLAFIGQIQLAELATTPITRDLPPAGLLSFFYDAEGQPWHETKAPGSWRAEYHPPGAALVPQQGKAPSFEACKAALTSHWALAPANDPGWLALWRDKPSEEEWSLVQLLVDELPRLQGSQDHRSSQLLGYASFIQGEPFEAPPPGESPDRLLLQVSSNQRTGMMWGDSGMIYFWIKADELARLDFSKVWGHLECY